MTDRRGIINKIEELLGSGGSREEAEAMFEELDSRGWIYFSETDGYSITEISDADWMAAMAASEPRVSAVME